MTDAGSDVRTVKPGQVVVIPFAIARRSPRSRSRVPAGAAGRVGVPHDEAIPAAEPSFYKNVSIADGPAPVRAYIDELLADILDGRIDPGRVFDRVAAAATSARPVARGSAEPHC